jgi:hypothetical protein
MGKLARVATLATSLLAAAGVASAAAEAVTWHNVGSTAFTATGGATTLSSTGTSILCSGSTTSGTLPTITTTFAVTISLTTTYTGCTLGGIPTTLDCGETFTGTSQTNGKTTGALDLTCSAYQFATKICHFSGARGNAAYFNAGNLSGFFSLDTGGNIFTSNGTSGVCPLGNGDHLHARVDYWQATGGPLGPIILRTA